jgi:hypothetical protein
MKTLKLITAMVLVVGLIGVFSAFGAEQTTKGKKLSPETSTTKGKKPSPGTSRTVKQKSLFVKKPDLKVEHISYVDEREPGREYKPGTEPVWIKFVVKNVGLGPMAEDETTVRNTSVEIFIGRDRVPPGTLRSRLSYNDLKDPGGEQEFRIRKALDSPTGVEVRVDLRGNRIAEVDESGNNRLRVTLPMVRVRQPGRAAAAPGKPLNTREPRQPPVEPDELRATEPRGGEASSGRVGPTGPGPAGVTGDVQGEASSGRVDPTGPGPAGVTVDVQGEASSGRVDPTGPGPAGAPSTPGTEDERPPRPIEAPHGN